MPEINEVKSGCTLDVQAPVAPPQTISHDSRKIPGRAVGETPPKKRGGANGHPNGDRQGSAEKDNAASDGASGTSIAGTAVTAPAGRTDRSARAEVALSPGSSRRPRAIGAASRKRRAKAQVDEWTPEQAENAADAELPPGILPLPENSAGFVDAIHERVDLVAVWEKLLRSDDLKIVQRALESTHEMKYGKGAAQSDEPQRIIIDVPRPQRNYDETPR